MNERTRPDSPARTPPPRAVIISLLTNVGKVLRIAWQTDPKITVLYYLTAAIGAVLPIISVYFIKLLVDRVQSPAIPTALLPVVILWTVFSYYFVTFMETVVHAGYGQYYLDYLFRYKLQNRISLLFQHKITSLDIGHFENAHTQELIAKTRETMLWRIPDFLRIFSYLFREMIAYATAFVVLFPFGWWVPLTITLITLPRLYLRATQGAVQWSLWSSGAPQVQKLWYLNTLLQSPAAVKEMRMTRAREALIGKFQHIQQELFELNKKPLDRFLAIITLLPILEIACLITVVTRFIPHVVQGTLTAGSFTMLIALLRQLNERAASTAARSGELYEHNFYLNDFFTFMSLPSLVPVWHAPVVLEPLEPPAIEFRNVSFRYPGGPEVIHDISFSIAPKESVAFVGANGAGKSTIVKLLCRFYDVTDGAILIKGTDIRHLDLGQWYRFLGTLFQEPVHYHFTVKENIMLGDPANSDERLMKQAAEQAGVTAFIDTLTGRFDQLLGKEFAHGEELSVGQWQRLAIARAFYRCPPVLILDEPTSAIDAQAEHEIFNNLASLYAEKTLLLVSHRFSTVRNAAKIIVIDHGRIIEQGSHDELMRTGGTYASMFSLQAAGYQ